MTSGSSSATSQTLAPRRHPIRTCVACRTERQKRDLMRVVRGPDGTLSLDRSGRAPGRGAYLCADGACWSSALKKKSIERALSAALPPELRTELELGSPVSPSVGGGEHHGPQ